MTSTARSASAGSSTKVAAPPVGELRWARPRPVTWDEPLAAVEAAPPCPQAHDSLDGSLQAGDGQEDCLHLNVLRPEGAEDLPVLFFIHGGSFADGWGGAATFVDDPALAERAVLVTHDYRLGALGWLAHPALSAADPDGVSGNLGLRDTLAALRWVRDNARAFGGDPDRILVFGESAGGLATCALLMSPEAEGLFAAAAIESASCGAILRPLRGADERWSGDSAEEQGERFAEAAGCDGAEDVVGCLRDLDVEAVLAALPARKGTTGDGEPYGLAVDGVLIPGAAPDRFSAGAFHRVPVAAGVNANEGVMFTGWFGIEDAETLERTLRAAGREMGIEDLDGLVALYPAEDWPSAQAAFDAFYGDAVFVCPTRSFLGAIAPFTDARGFFFDQAPSWLEGTAWADWGAFHGSELPFVFGTLPAYADADDRATSEAMRAAWTSLAGDAPTLDGAEAWPLFTAGGGEDPYGGDGGTWARFAAGAEVVTGVRREVCDFFDAQGWTRF